ncbi:MAG: hypothetical protein IPH00_11670 [Flavobacteriales bacterium]|nr:hypothetical protein [Flavobacteriales bacterium]
MPTYADIILPLAVPGVFTCEVPEALAGRVTAGISWWRPSAGRKMYSGLVLRTHGSSRRPYRAAHLGSLGRGPVATEEQLALWQAISEHYMYAGRGDACCHARPAGAHSSTRLIAAPEHPRHGPVITSATSCSMPWNGAMS